MDTIRDLHNRGLPQFTDDIHNIRKILENGENISLCSAPHVGDNFLLDYLDFILKKENEYNVVYDSQNRIDLRNTRNILNSKRKTLLLIPWLYNDYAGFYGELEDLFLNAKPGQIQSIIRIHYDLWINPKKYFKKSSRPIGIIYIRKPFNLKYTKKVIEQRSRIDNWDIPESKIKTIYKLSGGIAGLITRICSYYSYNKNLKIQDLIQYPAIYMRLMEFEKLFKDLSDKRTKEMGLTNRAGKIKSKLIETWIGHNTPKIILNLTPTEQEVLDYFEKRMNKVVSLEELSDHLNKAEFSLWANYKMITRFKNKIREKYVLRNIKGKGYILRNKYA